MRPFHDRYARNLGGPFNSWNTKADIDHGFARPHVDQNGYGIRVPGIVISPYAKKGYVATRRSASTRTPSSSSTIFSLASGLIQKQMADLILAPTSAKMLHCSAI